MGLPASIVASVVFGLCGLLAATASEYVLRTFAEEAGMNRLIFISVPGLFAMLFALVLYSDAQSRIRRLGESISRGILIALLTWFFFSILVSWAWCPPGDVGGCLGHTLLATAALGGGPLLGSTLVAGIVVGVIIIRPRRRRIAGEDE